MPPNQHPLRIAHRGMPRQARENTLASFALALAARADGIELDVHATADGYVVVHHDAALADGTPISATTLPELRELAVSPALHIPTLRDVCALVKTRAELFVEIKGDGIERAVVDVMASHDGPFAIHSFDHAMIRRVAKLQTGYRLGILIEHAGTDVVTAMRESGASDAWPHTPLVTQALVLDVHTAGGRVIPWTVNEPTAIAHLAALGVDGLCSDDVTLLPHD